VSTRLCCTSWTCNIPAARGDARLKVRRCRLQRAGRPQFRAPSDCRMRGKRTAAQIGGNWPIWLGRRRPYCRPRHSWTLLISATSAAWRSSRATRLWREVGGPLRLAGLFLFARADPSFSGRSGCSIATACLLTNACRNVQSIASARPGQSDGSRAICPTLCSSALIQTHKPCAQDVARQSSARHDEGSRGQHTSSPKRSQI
jgi:hypothetical protein